MRNLFILTVIALFSICGKAQVAPVAILVTSNTLHCTNVPITFSAQLSETPQSYTWAVVPSRGLGAYSDLNSPTLSLTFTSSNVYNIYLNVTTSTGTVSITYTTIAVNKSANASFNASFNSVGYPTQLILTNYSTNTLKNYWTFNDDSSAPDSSVNIVKEYPVSGSYKVTLLALGIKGCNDTQTYQFRISDSSSVVLPNIFTPNGDGANDVFKPMTRGISSLNAWVYNRYGVIVCHWDKVKGGWDGHTTSGEECSDGVYFVVVEAFGFDGKAHKLKSTITLIR